MGSNSNIVDASVAAAAIVSLTSDYCQESYQQESFNTLTKDGNLSSIYTDHTSPQNTELIRVGLDAIKGLGRFKKSSNRKLGRLSKRHDKVYENWEKTSQAVEGEDVSSRKHKRLSKKATRLEKRRERIERRDSRLDAIVDAAPSLGLQDPATYAEARAALLAWEKNGNTNNNKLSRPKLTKEKWLILAIAAHQHQEASREKTIAANLALNLAGEEYDRLNGIYQRLMEGKSSPGAIDHAMADIKTLLEKNPRLRVILDAAKVWGLKDPSYIEAKKWVQARLDACKPTVTSQPSIPEKKIARPATSEVPVDHADKLKSSTELKQLAVDFLNSVRMGELKESVPYSKKLTDYYKSAARKMLAWAEACQDTSDKKVAYLQAAYCWGQAGELSAVETALNKYKDNSGDETVARKALAEAQCRAQAAQCSSNKDYQGVLDNLNKLGTIINSTDLLQAILACLMRPDKLGHLAFNYMEQYQRQASTSLPLPQKLITQITLIKDLEDHLPVSGTLSPYSLIEHRGLADRALKFYFEVEKENSQFKNYFLKMASFHYFYSGNNSHAYTYLRIYSNKQPSDDIAELTLRRIKNSTVGFSLYVYNFQGPTYVKLINKDDPTLTPIYFKWDESKNQEVSRARLSQGKWVLEVEASGKTKYKKDVEVTVDDRFLSIEITDQDKVF